MEETRIAFFLADFDHQVTQIDKIYSRLDARMNTLASDNVTPEIVESSAYWLHNLYCAYEDLFKIVSSFWENNIADNGAFHRSLIRRMLLNIEGVRPGPSKIDKKLSPVFGTILMPWRHKEIPPGPLCQRGGF